MAASTTVVIQEQPKAVPMVTNWSSGLCHCCQNMSSCCYAFWCFPCFTCSTSAEFGESRCLPLVDICGPALVAATGVGVCIPPVTLSMRVAIRYKYQITGSLCEDILISCFCVCCSWCQMSREIKHRKRTQVVVMAQPAPAVATIATVSSVATVVPGV